MLAHCLETIGKSMMISKQSNFGLSATIVLLIAAIPIASCTTGVVFKPKHPTHKVVCACECSVSESGPSPIDDITSQTYDPPSGGCGTLNNTTCKTGRGQDGKLKNCKRDTVPTSLVQGRDALEIAQ